MESPTHEDLVEFFHNHLELACELARRAGVPFGRDYARLELVHTEFRNPLRPGKRVRADTAIVAYTGKKPRRGLVFEIQLGDHWDKQWSVVLYRAGLRFRLKRPAWAVMFCPDAEVRRSLSRRGFRAEPELRPPLITPKMIPDIRDLDVAIADYPWAVLSAIMHGSGEGAVIRASVAIQALLHNVPRHHDRYIRVISDILGAKIMQQVRQQLPTRQRVQLSKLERRGGTFTLGLEEGREQGLEQGLEQGRKQGRAQGRKQALRAALRDVLEARGFALDGRTKSRVRGCASVEQLRGLIARASTISNIEELFGEPKPRRRSR